MIAREAAIVARLKAQLPAWGDIVGLSSPEIAQRAELRLPLGIVVFESEDLSTPSDLLGWIKQSGTLTWQLLIVEDDLSDLDASRTRLMERSDEAHAALVGWQVEDGCPVYWLGRAFDDIDEESGSSRLGMLCRFAHEIEHAAVEVA